MIIHCDNCRKKYKIDSTKLNTDKITFVCKQCGQKVTHILNETPAPEPAVEEIAASSSAQPVRTPVSAPGNESDRYNLTMALESGDYAHGAADSQKSASKASKRRFGLNAKMLLLFFLIPVCLVMAASAIFFWQLKTLTGKIGSDSYRIVERLSRELVNDTAEMVANQCRLYLDAHPDLLKEEFNLDVEFRSIALQTVGETGYTCIYSVPDKNNISAVWIHPNERITGIDLPPAMKKAMGSQYEAWFKIYKGAYNGKASSGYYKWKEKDGSIRNKYMTCVPVKGTPYIVAATTYVDEINRDVYQLRNTAKQMQQKSEMIILVVFAVTILLMGCIVLFYSRRLRANLVALINAAEKISVGELNTEVRVSSKDEISDLAETISRMQESIRLSIERLRRRR